MKEKFKFYVEKDGFWAEASVILMAMAVFFRLIGTINGWSDRSFALTQIILPVLSFIRSLSYSNIPAEPSISA